MRMAFLRAIEFQLDWPTIILNFAECVKSLVIGHLLYGEKRRFRAMIVGKMALEREHFQPLREGFVFRH